MSDDFTEKFFAWLKKEHISKEHVAAELGNSTSTISKWQSIGVPAGKRYACQAFMDRFEQQGTIPSNQLTLIIGLDEYRRWNLAANAAGEVITDWVYNAAEAAADEWEKQEETKKTFREKEAS